MVQTNITSDVKVNSTHLDKAPAAELAAFRTFVANATIGGVFQGNAVPRPHQREYREGGRDRRQRPRHPV